MATREIDAQFPPNLIKPLFDEKARYRIFYGGRGGGKSWAIARALLIKGIGKPLRILCVREFMSSVQDSVWKLLSGQIHELGLTTHYTIESARIFCANGTEFRFAGIRNNVSAIKSYEAIDICWAEEAQNVTKESWSVLIPTIRKTDSEIWVSFNPEHEDDETYQRFIVSPPPRTIITKSNFTDNPFCPDVIREEAAYMKDNDPVSYHNIWLGFPKTTSVDAIYGRELREATEEGRLTKVQYERLTPVHTFWDLGWRDSTSIIFAQVVGQEFHVIDYIQNSQTTTNEYLKMLQKKPYVYGFDYLPHDAKAREKGSGRSIEEIMRGHGRNVRIVPRLSIEDGINAARTIFPQVWIDDHNCASLIQCLRKYRYDAPSTGTKVVPVHDEFSHGADAWRYMSVSLRAPRQQPKPVVRPEIAYSETGWMA